MSDEMSRVRVTTKEARSLASAEVSIYGKHVVDLAADLVEAREALAKHTAAHEDAIAMWREHAAGEDARVDAAVRSALSRHATETSGAVTPRVATARARELLAAPYVAYIPDARALRGIGHQDAGDAARVERDVHDLAADLIAERARVEAVEAERDEARMVAVRAVELAERRGRLIDGAMNLDDAMRACVNVLIAASAGAPNCTAWEGSANGRDYVLSVQWLDGKNPHALLAEATDRLAALGTQRDELQAIVDGRTIPPTDEEREAHRLVYGTWFVIDPDGARWCPPRSAVWLVGERPPEGSRWWAVDSGGHLCQWPNGASAKGL